VASAVFDRYSSSPVSKAFALVILFVLLQSSIAVLDHNRGTESSPVTSVKVSQSSIEVNLSCGTPRLETTHDFVRILLPGFSSSGEEGCPSLPSQRVNYLLPPDGDPASIRLRISGESTRTILLQARIEPIPSSQTSVSAPQPILGMEDGDLDIAGGLNATLYGQDSYLPVEVAKIVSVSHMRTYLFATLEYKPIQYNPARDLVLLHDSVHAYLELNLTGVECYSGDHVLDDIAQRTFSNWDIGSGWYRGDNSKVHSLAMSSGTGYVIVTTNRIVQDSKALPRFITYLQDFKHFTVYVATEDEFGTAGGLQRSLNIRNWLIDNYLVKSVRYVLLIGDPVLEYGIPMLHVWPRSGELTYQDTYTDYFYAELTGDWNSDNDLRYGENSEMRDLWAEVFVGRVPVNSARSDYVVDLDYILEKMTNYRFVDSVERRKSALLPMAVTDYTYDTNGRDLPKYLIEDVLNSEWNHFVLYEAEGINPIPTTAPYYSSGLSKNQVIREWQNGYGLVFWSGHGNNDGAFRKIWTQDSNHDGVPQNDEMSFVSFFSSEDATRLDNVRPSIVFQDSCLNGFPGDTSDLGYSLLEHGAVATVSSAAVSWYKTGLWTPYSSDWADGASIGYAFFYGCIKNGNTIGEALYQGKWSAHALGNAQSLMNILDFNLYGDPSLSINDVDSEGSRLREYGDQFIASESSNVGGSSTYPGGVTLSVSPDSEAYSTYEFEMEGESVESLWIGVHLEDNGWLNSGPGLEAYNFKTGVWNVVSWPIGKAERHYDVLIDPAIYLSMSKHLKVRVHAAWNDATDLWYVDVLYTRNPSAIVVNSPNGGETWNAGTSQLVKWTSSGTFDFVKIQLLKGGTLATTIDPCTPNDGAYAWAIPSSQQVGDDYRVRVCDVDESVWDESDGNFEISQSSTGVPSSPKNLQVRWNQDLQPTNPRGLLLSWQTPDSAGNAPISGYDVYKGTSPSGETWCSYVPVGLSLAYVDTDIGYGLTYYYYVKAKNILGDSGKSNEVSYYVLSQGSGYSLVRTAVCTAVQAVAPYDPIDEKRVFRSTDEIVLTWVHLAMVYEPLTVKWDYLDPQGILFQHSLYYSIPSPHDYGYDYWEYYKPYYGWYLAGYSTADMEGVWTVNVYVDDGSGFVRIATEHYTIRYEITGRTMAKDVQPYSPYDPVNPSSSFLNTEPRAYAWIEMSNLAEGLELKWDWIEPGGALYTTFNYVVPDPQTYGYPYYDWYRCWGYIDIYGTPAQWMTGSWRVDAYIKDAFGNWDLEYSQIFQLADNTPPGVPGTPNGGGPFSRYASISYAWDAASEDSSVCQYQLQVGTTPGGSDVFDGFVGDALSATITDLNEGVTYYARVRAMNFVGQWGDWSASSDGVTVDSTPPQSMSKVSGTLGNNGYYVSDVYVWIQTYDSTSGVKSIYYCLLWESEVGIWSEYLGPIRIGTEGHYALLFYSEDWAGNIGDVGEEHINVDLSPPSCSVVINNGEEFTDSSLVTVSVSAFDYCSGPSAMSISLDGQSWGLWVPYADSFDIYLLPGDGERFVYVQVVDAAGFVSSISFDSIIVDETPPLTIMSVSGQRTWENWYASSAVVGFNASDPVSGLWATYYKLDAGIAQRYYGPFIVSGDGMHMIVYYSVDEAGNYEFEHAVEIGITTLIEFSISLQTGWNLLSIPLLNDSIKASTLGLQTGDIVAAWDSTNQSYGQTYVVGVSGPAYDFSIDQGVSYMVWVAVETQIVVRGIPPSVLPSYCEPLTVGSSGGWTCVGIISVSSTMHASDLASSVSGADVLFVSKWNATSGMYEDYVVGISPSSFDFEIEPGQGYWIWISQPGVLEYSP